MRACIYVRVSTEEQLEGYSIGVQLEVCRSFCLARGWTIVFELAEEGQSAKNFKGRTKWQEVRRQAEHKQFDVLVCHKIDRFSRGTILTSLNELSWLRRSDVTFASATEPLDFTSSYGELMLMMFLWFARHYIVNLSAEVTKGRKARVQAGLSNATHPPFGYTRNKAGQDVPVKALTPVVVEMFERSAGGAGDTAIAWWLNELGHRTFENKLFTRTSVREMLVNRFYVGEVGYAGLAPGEVGERKRNSRRRQDWYAGQHPGIISVDLFSQVKAARKKRHILRGARPVLPYRVYLLRTLAVCADCGTRLTASASMTGRLRYQCLAVQKGIDCAAHQAMVWEDHLAPQVDALMQSLQLPAEVLGRARELSQIAEPVVSTSRKREEIEAEMERIDFIFEKGRMTQLAYDRKLAALTDELTLLATEPVVQTTPTPQEWAAMLDAWVAGDALYRHETLRSMLNAVAVDTRTQQIVRWEPKTAYAPLFKAARI